MLKNVRIKNFKSLDVSVDLDPVTVLVGRSGTGKTNFVEALRFLRDFLDPRSRNQVFQAEAIQVPSATAQVPLSMSFDITFDVQSVEQDLRYELVLAYQQRGQHPQLSEEKLSLGTKVLFHHKGAKWVREPEVVVVPQLGQHLPILSLLNGIREVTVVYLVLTNGIGCYDFPSDVLLPARSNKATEKGLGDFGENYLDTLNGIESNLNAPTHWKEIVAALKCLNPSIKGVAAEMPGLSRVVVTHDFCGRGLSLDLGQESEGFRRFLAHLMALYQSPSKQTLVFEEPEKGIHPGALAVLAEQLNACPDARRGQIILTTHSPDLLDHLPPDSIRVVQMQDLVTKIGPVAKEQIEAVRDHLLRTGELLTVDPARMELAAMPGA